MRRCVAPTLGFVALSLASVCHGDPLPVHTATTRVATTGIQANDRLSLADAVAETLRTAGTTEVLTASETRNRLQEIGPVGLSCDTASCANTVFNPVRARAIVLVRQSRTRGRVAFEIQFINLRGEVVLTETRDEAIATWDEAIAIARVAAERFAQHLTDEQRGVTTQVVTTPEHTEVVHVVRTLPPPLPVVPQVRYVQRPWEIGVGAGAIAGGVALAIAGIANLAVSSAPSDGLNNTQTIRCPAGVSLNASGACDGVGAVSPLLLVVGAVAIGGGVYVLYDGLRRRAEVIPTAEPRVTVGATPLAHGAALVLSGTF